MYTQPFTGTFYAPYQVEQYQPYSQHYNPYVNAPHPGWDTAYNREDVHYCAHSAYPVVLHEESFTLPRNSGSVSMTKSQCDFRAYMRLLWNQHVEWTRMVIMSIVFGLPDLEASIARLLQNATDSGNSLKPYYGEQAAAQYAKLMNDHLVLAADLVKAAKAGDMQKAAEIEKKWYANADEIVQFLGSIMPYLDQEQFKKMFYNHLALTKSEAVSMLKKDYKTSIKLYDQIEMEALMMAEMLSDAIIKQFPQMFQ
ncbi:acetylglutamate kinase [Paenibacillus marinisediminis]